MITTFEDPRKADLRERVALAVEAAGLEIVAVELIAIPPDAGLQGGILGDVRAVDGEGVRHAFYVRTASDRPVPQWIASYAHASHSLEKVEVHIVVEQSSAVLERSCRACGAGLLQVVSDGDYRLLKLIDPAEYDPQKRRADLEARAKTARRRLVTKLDVNLGPLKDKLGRLPDLTKGMSPDKQGEYEEHIDNTISRLYEWSDEASRLLDGALASSDENALASAERLITEEGNIET
jgi:hypothetical protein